jgi:hypothetical protein
MKENEHYFPYKYKSDDEKNKFNTGATLRNKVHLNVREGTLCDKSSDS